MGKLNYFDGGCEMETGRYSSDMRLKKLGRSKPIDRLPFILSRCSGKNVLDIGCADFPMTAEKARNGELLYANLCRVAEVTGIDYDRSGATSAPRGWVGR